MGFLVFPHTEGHSTKTLDSFLAVARDGVHPLGLKGRGSGGGPGSSASRQLGSQCQLCTRIYCIFSCGLMDRKQNLAGRYRMVTSGDSPFELRPPTSDHLNHPNHVA